MDGTTWVQFRGVDPPGTAGCLAMTSSNKAMIQIMRSKAS